MTSRPQTDTISIRPVNRQGNLVLGESARTSSPASKKSTRKGREKVFSPVRGRLLSPGIGPGRGLRTAAEGELEIDRVDDEVVAVEVLEPGMEDDVGPAHGQVDDLERQHVDLGVLEDGELPAVGERGLLLFVPLVQEVHVADDVAEGLAFDRARWPGGAGRR